MLEDSTVAGNSAYQGRRHLYNQGTMTVVNSTIAGNQAAATGGGIDNLAHVDGGQQHDCLQHQCRRWRRRDLDQGRRHPGQHDRGREQLNGDGDDLDRTRHGSFTGSNNLVVYDATGTFSSNDNLLGVDRSRHRPVGR